MTAMRSAQRHGFDLVVRDVDDGRLEPLVQQLDLGAHFHAQLGVQVGQRLVEQEQRRVARDRPAHRHPLALAAGELRRLAVEQVLHLQDLGDRDRRFRPAGRFGTLRISRPKEMFWRTVMFGYSA